MLNKFQKNAVLYPTLARMARDVCAIPGSSVPCERLFSAGAEIATDRRSRIGATRFEELQVLKHAWRDSIVDRASINMEEAEEVSLQEYKELFERDEEMAKTDERDGIEVVEW